MPVSMRPLGLELPDDPLNPEPRETADPLGAGLDVGVELLPLTRDFAEPLDVVAELPLLPFGDEDDDDDEDEVVGTRLGR
jgi:hypothetical protein